MQRSKNLATVLAIFLGIGAFTTVEAPAAPVPFTITQLGTEDPAWRPVNFWLFTAPGGTEEEIDETIAKVFTEHFSDPYVEHSNFVTEVEENLAKAGIQTKTVFTVEEFTGIPGTGNNAIHLAWVSVPNTGATGASRDFPAGGPIIPNSSFPINEDGDLLLNGEVVDPLFDGDRNPSGRFEGFSHLTTLITAHQQFLEDPTISTVGSYIYTETQTDPNGNGWRFEVPFTIVESNEPIPEPSTLMILGGSLAALGLLRRRRKSF